MEKKKKKLLKCSRCSSPLVKVLLSFLVLLFVHEFVVLAVSVEKLVPPGEGRGVVSDKVHVVEVMEPRPGVEWDQMHWVERDVIAAVHINGLQKTEGHPGPQEENVVTEDHDSNEKPGSQDQGLQWVGVFSLHAKRGSELVVDLVDVFVDAAMVQEAVEEVMPGVLDNCTAKALPQDVRPAWH